MTSAIRTPTVGVIGLGVIGSGVAARLADDGFRPTVFDVLPETAVALSPVTDRVSSAAEVAARSEVVVIAVVTAEQARDVLIGPAGLLAAERADLVVLLMSTVSVTAVRELAGLAGEHAASLLDVGVTQAGDGRLVSMVGGPVETLARIRPVLEAWSKAVVHCGPLGSGMVTKLARNMITYASWAVIREAVDVALAAGVEPSIVLEVIDAAADGPDALTLLRGQVAGQPLTAEQGAVVNELAQKDLAAAQRLAGELAIETPIVDVARSRMPDALAGRYSERLPDERWDRGLAMVDRVYGAGFQENFGHPERPVMSDLVEHLFGDIWARGHLTMRDRRLLTIGATTMLGQQSLLELQLRSGMNNGEFTVDQVREMELFLTYYASAQNGSAFLTAAQRVITERER